MVLDTLYDVPCKIIHITTGNELSSHADTLKIYFEKFGGLVMMGGDQDAASKGIAGIHISPSGTYLLVVVSIIRIVLQRNGFNKQINTQDPHFSGIVQSSEQLAAADFVCWRNIESFSKSSFYNLCLPQIKINSIV